MTTTDAESAEAEAEAATRPPRAAGRPGDAAGLVGRAAAGRPRGDRAEPQRRADLRRAQRPGQPAGPGPAPARRRGRRRRRAAVRQPPRVRGGRRRRPAGRPPADDGELAPDRRRGRLHRRRLRGPGARRRRRASPTSPSARSPQAADCPVRLAVGGAIEGFEPLRRRARRRGPAPTSTTRRSGSTMLYTSGTTGRPKGVYRRDAAPSASRGRSTCSATGPASDRPPVHRAAVPRRAAGVLAAGPADATASASC